MTITTLQEAMQYVEKIKDNPELLDNDELSIFASTVDNVATDLLKDRDGEYLSSMLSLVQSMAVVCLIQENPLLALRVMSNIGDFNEYALFVMKFVIGLAAMEEIR